MWDWLEKGSWPNKHVGVGRLRPLIGESAVAPVDGHVPREQLPRPPTQEESTQRKCHVLLLALHPASTVSPRLVIHIPSLGVSGRQPTPAHSRSIVTYPHML